MTFKKMPMRKNEINKLLIESGLIIFSVLFALFLNRLADNHKTSQQKRTAMERIHNELTNNQMLIGEVITHHQVVFGNLTKLINQKDDSLQQKLYEDGSINFEFLTEGKSIFPRFPSNTAWEAAKFTGIIAELDYPLVEAYTDVYSSQEWIVQETIPKILDDLHALGNKEAADQLFKLRLKFEELIAQEKTLLYYYKEAISKTG